jgi:hypothetical protein
MALEVAGVKKAVNLSWDVNAVGGELCRLIARNEETGAVSNTNWSGNDGFGVLTYPLDYEGTTTVLVEGTGGGTESGTVKISATGAEIVEDGGGEPVEPPDTGEPPDPNEPHPEHPIWDESLPHPSHPIEMPGEEPHPEPH